MRSFRISIGGFMALLMILAADFAIVRSLWTSQYDYNIETSSGPLHILVFVFGVLPMASLLLAVAVVQAPRLAHQGKTSSFFVGFEAAGWAALAVFILWSVLAPSAIARYGTGIASAMRPIMPPLLSRLPDWAGFLLEFGVCALIFGLPELVVAMIGGAVTRKLGIVIAIEPRCQPCDNLTQDSFPVDSQIERDE